MVDTDSNDDELFSMDELEKDLKRPRRGRGALWFVAGLVLGVAGSILLPRYAGPYLPFGGGGEVLSGPVLSEERDGERLLLTIEAEQGAFIASFSRRVSEIALLVEPGDTVAIAAEGYDPFIEDPDFEGVRKAHASGEGAGPPPTPGPAERGAEEAEPPAVPDSTVADTSETIDRDTAVAPSDTAGARRGRRVPARPA